MSVVGCFQHFGSIIILKKSCHNFSILIGCLLLLNSVSASVTSSTHERKSKTVIVMEKERIYLQLNQFTKLVSCWNLHFLWEFPMTKFVYFIVVGFADSYYGNHEGYGYGE